MKKIYASLLAFTLLLTGCSSTANTTTTPTIVSSIITTFASSLTIDYSSFDLDETYENATIVDLNEIQDQLEITKAGTYVLSGELNGVVTINVGENDKVHLVLNGVTITSSTTSPIEVIQADKVSITLADNTTNTIKDLATYSEEDTRKGAAIYSASSLTINGNGKLVIDASYHNGIGSKKNIKIIRGEIDITSQNNGIKGNNSVVVKDGIITISSVGDGIKTEEEEDTEKGYVYIEDGTIRITSMEDGIAASQYLIIENGDIQIETTGDVTASGSSSNDFPGGFMNKDFSNHNNFPGNSDEATPDGTTKPEFPGNNENGMNQMPPKMPSQDGTRPSFENGDMNRPSRPSNEENTESGSTVVPNRNTQGNEHIASQEQNEVVVTEEENDLSSKGLKANTELFIKDGNITIQSTDHCLKSDGTLTILNGKLQLTSTRCKGITAESDIIIQDGDILIQESYEGIETKAGTVCINGGTIDITSSDDGINASGNRISDIQFNSGTVYINAQGDGIDGNNTVSINGGQLIIAGPTNGANSALDSDGGITINGGTIIAYGSASMLELPDSTNQNTVSITFDTTYPANSKIKVVDSSNNTVVEFTNEKSFQNVIFSDGSLVNGDYKVFVNEDEVNQFTISSTLTTIGSTGMGTMGGRGNKLFDRQQPQEQ